MPTVKRLLSFFAVLSLAIALNCNAQEKQEKVDLETISKIRYEGFHNSKIMEIASGLRDQIGPRLTGSPNMKKANEWTRDKLKEFGLVNSHLEPWEPFGRGWANEYVNVRGETSLDAYEFRKQAQPFGPGRVDEKAKSDYLAAAFSDAIAIYMLSLCLDVDYYELREREYALLAPSAMAERLKKIAELFPPNPGFQFNIFYKRKS